MVGVLVCRRVDLGDSLGTTARATVLTLRLPADMDRRISREARRRSLLVSRRASEREAIDFIEHAAGTRGWR